MHPFFRPRRALASAPDATPYQRAGQIWDDRMGLSLAHARNWRRLAVANLGLAAFLGHVFPFTLKFRGGKGVATALGVLLALSWPVALICALVWLVMAFGFKVSSLAALAATLVSPIAAYFLMPHGSWVVATMIIALLVLYRHQSNIKNLLGGKEGKIGGKAE